VIDGQVSFAEIDKLALSRFASLPADWRSQRGWDPLAEAA
jgi:sarcosine oxidase subunit beta